VTRIVIASALSGTGGAGTDERSSSFGGGVVALGFSRSCECSLLMGSFSSVIVSVVS
jgi:hypothetical protein